MASASTSAQPKIPKPQYHHFIPRFILRNFAHASESPRSGSKGSAKRSKRRNKGAYNPDEPMLYTADLGKTTAEIIETPVSRTFGLTDMYRDFADATNQHYIEEQLSKLESRAAGIITRIRKAFEAGDKEVWLVRSDRDTLRKFLFIMKYRASRQHKRFYHENAEGYSEDDTGRMLQYMREKGFQKPIDVWFNNIKAMLELKMDPEGNWMEDLVKRAYPDDAMWFISHTQMMYLALCTPSDPDDEFLLTENAYGVHEGPVSCLINPKTGDVTEMHYTVYHMFAVISPKLMIVLRNFLLPDPQEDLNEDIRNWRETMYRLNAGQHIYPRSANSVLADLPISKARNSYTRMVEGRRVLLDNEDGSHRAYHKFCFRFFPLLTEHVNKINTIMLEELTGISKIVFKSRVGARKTLEYYLRVPSEHGFKLVMDTPNDPKLVCLKKLEQVVKLLDSDVIAVYQAKNSMSEEQLEEEFEILAQEMAKALPKEPSEFMKLYMKLGGSGTALLKDMEQARRMVNMRIKIDVWSQGLDEMFREGIRENLRDLFCQLPPRRVWYYLKHIRNMQLKGGSPRGKNVLRLDFGQILDGPEDIIVRGISHLIRGSDLCRLMYFATMNHIKLVLNPDVDFAAEITLDEDGFRQLLLIKSLAFSPSGSICDCGIPAIEEKARLYRDMVRMTRRHEEYKNPFWTDEENIEMVIRFMVRGDVSELLSKDVSGPDLKALETVLFEIVYPSLGSR